MVYLSARKIPIVSDTIDEGGHTNGIFSKVESLLNSIPYDKLDYSASQFLEKFLRKTKLYLMKLDNQLNKHLEKFKHVKMQTHFRIEKKFALFEKLTEDEEKIEEVSDSGENELTEEIDIKPNDSDV